MTEAARELLAEIDCRGGIALPGKQRRGLRVHRRRAVLKFMTGASRATRLHQRQRPRRPVATTKWADRHSF
jgi:hypothetical protein